MTTIKIIGEYFRFQRSWAIKTIILDNYHHLQNQAKNVIHSQTKYEELAMEELERAITFRDTKVRLKTSVTGTAIGFRSCL